MSVDESIPAFPPPVDSGKFGDKGMTLRDYFAGQALTGLISIKDNRMSHDPSFESLDNWRRVCKAEDARFCYLMADAMIKERDSK